MFNPYTARELKLRQAFIDSVTKHVVTINDAIYRRYITQAHSGQLAGDELERFDIDVTPRVEWAMSNISASYDPLHLAGIGLQEIGHIEALPVYFVESQGIYYFCEPESLVMWQIWLTWPAYPPVRDW